MGLAGQGWGGYRGVGTGFGFGSVCVCVVGLGMGWCRGEGIGAKERPTPGGVMDPGGVTFGVRVVGLLVGCDFF